MRAIPYYRNDRTILAQFFSFIVLLLLSTRVNCFVLISPVGYFYYHWRVLFFTFITCSTSCPSSILDSICKFVFSWDYVQFMGLMIVKSSIFFNFKIFCFKIELILFVQPLVKLRFNSSLIWLTDKTTQFIKYNTN